ncbi:MAG: alanine racemase [Candidatus Acidiferrales bacterium]
MTKSIHVGGRPVWAEISLKAILRNLEIIREHVNPGRRVGRVGREAGSETGGGFLGNEKRTGKSACATQGENQKNRQEASGTKSQNQKSRQDALRRGSGQAGATRDERQKGRMILAVVKSNAYGLGAVPISKALQKAGTEWFGVTCANEGIELRESGIRKRILVLTGFWPGEEKRLLENYLTPTVTRVDDLRHLERAAKSFLGKFARGRSSSKESSRVPFHLKINTGMNRLGISALEVEAFARALAECPHLELEGTFTHFASAEDFIGGQTVTQEELFRSCLDRLRALGVEPGIVHLANSGAICARPETWADMVRPGAILYGYHQRFDPPEKRSGVMAEMSLEPSLSLRARIISLRDVPPGQAVGYSARFITERASKIAVINAGYADGVVRARTNRGCALVRERRVPLVGTISMDLTMLDVTDVPGVALGDVVTIYGKDGKAAIEVSDVAPEIGTVTSDLLCALGRRVPKYYV